MAFGICKSRVADRDFPRAEPQVGKQKAPVIVGEGGEYVREAVTLERLEYCILLDENGNKRYIQGPSVVFPGPTETFVGRQGSRKFKAIELNETSGIYVKVIAPYEEGGKSYKVGEELFLTGKDGRIQDQPGLNRSEAVNSKDPGPARTE